MSTVTYQLLVEQGGLLQPDSAHGGRDPAIAALAGGGFLATSAAGAPFPSYGVIRADDGGLITPHAFDLATIAGSTEQYDQVAGLAGGGVVAVFDDGTDHIRAHLFDAAGNPVAHDFIVQGDAHAQLYPDVAGLKDGGFVTAWQRETSPVDADIYATVSNLDGSPRANVIIAASASIEVDPHVAALIGGGFAATWVKEVGANVDTEIWAARYDANGNLQGSAQLVDNVGTLNQTPQIVSLQNGGFAIAYADNGWGTGGTDITLVTFDANGSQHPYVMANQGFVAGDQQLPAITTLSNGYISVGWGNLGGDTTDVAIFDQNGNFVFNDAGTLADHSMSLSLAGLANGRFAAVYVDESNNFVSDFKTVDVMRTTTGTAANEVLNGDSLRDLIDGGAGADTMAGGAGDDRYSVDNPGDQVIEKPGEGSDSVLSSIPFYTLPANVEVLQLNAGGDYDGTGNALDNFIFGNDKDNVLDGAGGNDTIFGGGGNDVINGGAGVDKMVGGAGDDGYLVDNASDLVIENANEGFDTVSALISYILPDNVERLTFDVAGGNLNGTGNSLDNQLFGTFRDNVLDGGAGADLMVGYFGNDTYIVENPGDVVMEIAGPSGGIDTIKASIDYTLPTGVENLVLLPGAVNGTGNNLDNVITGNAADNILTGGLGNDTIDGGAGDDTAAFSHNFNDYTVMDFGSKIVVSGPDGTDTLSGIEHLKFNDTTITPVDDGNPEFDTLYYLSRNADVFKAGVNALDHFNTNGWHEGRDPNAFFSVDQYLGANPDVKASGMNPLDHYSQIGWHQGRDPGANFDTTLYLIHNPDVAAAGIDPLAHYLQFGLAEGRQAYQAIGSTIVGGFDAEYYLFHNPDVAAAGVDPLAHFNAYGWHESRNPNAWFDTAGYLAHYADVAAANINPLEHYEQFGWHEGRDPSAAFDTLKYLAANPDVAAAHINPLDHFLQNGIYEGRVAINDGIWH